MVIYNILNKQFYLKRF